MFLPICRLRLTTTRPRKRRQTVTHRACLQLATGEPTAAAASADRGPAVVEMACPGNLLERISRCSARSRSPLYVSTRRRRRLNLGPAGRAVRSARKAVEAPSPSAASRLDPRRILWWSRRASFFSCCCLRRMLDPLLPPPLPPPHASNRVELPS